jgi:hypothetical protein
MRLTLRVGRRCSSSPARRGGGGGGGGGGGEGGGGGRRGRGRMVVAADLIFVVVRRRTLSAYHVSKERHAGKEAGLFFAGTTNLLQYQVYCFEEII